MLSYMNSGIRDYHQNPIRTYKRGVWEIQAVLSGQIAPVIPEQVAQDFREMTLWVFPPGSIHGWDGIRDRPAEILVFHFSQVAEELKNLPYREGYLSLSLNREEGIFLQDLFDRLYEEYPGTGSLYALKSRMTADGLALLICSRFSSFLAPAQQNEKNIVENAVALFSSELEYGISLNEIASRMGFSVAHMRRLFHKILDASPRSVFEEIRMKRAGELCRNTGYSMNEIAQACGYAEHSSFTKAFVRYWQRTPSETRSDRLKAGRGEINGLYN